MTVDEFFQIVDSLTPEENGCVIWRGNTSRGGYPILGLNRAKTGHRFVLSRKLGRSILPGMWALHTCDNPSCVNENHIYEGTNQQNKDDMVNRGRSLKGDRNPARIHRDRLPRGEKHWMRQHPERVPRGDGHWARKNPEKFTYKGDIHHFHLRPEMITWGKGEDHHNSKLTEKDVVQILELTETMTKTEIAKKFGVHKMTIGDITLGKTWRNVPRPPYSPSPGAEQSRTG